MIPVCSMYIAQYFRSRKITVTLILLRIKRENIRYKIKNKQYFE